MTTREQQWNTCVAIMRDCLRKSFGPQDVAAPLGAGFDGPPFYVKATAAPTRKARQPGRLLTMSAVARRVPARKADVIGAIRQGILVPDFVSDGGLKLFRAARLQTIRKILTKN